MGGKRSVRWQNRMLNIPEIRFEASSGWMETERHISTVATVGRERSTAVFCRCKRKSDEIMVFVGKTDRALDPSKEHAAVSALENGCGLRKWVAETLSGGGVRCIPCATFSIGSPGISWFTAIAIQCGANVLLLSDVNETDSNIAPSQFRQLFHAGRAKWRLLPPRPGNAATETGYFHPKVLIFDDYAAVVGSASLTGRALGLGVPPHHSEMSVGLRGEPARAAIVALLQAFERWWEDCIDLEPQASGHEAKGENVMPEYVAFTERPTPYAGQGNELGRRGRCPSVGN
jgi:hypothetical protein